MTRQTLQWNPAAGAESDVGTLLAHLETVAAHRHPALAGCAACLGRLRAAAEAYRGPFLGAFAGPPSDLFEEWAALKREGLRRRVAGALEQLAEAHLARGEPGPAAGYARRELELEPLAEGAHRRLMRALSAGGDRGAALAQYEACRRLLAAELGAEPAPETAALAERLRAGAAASPRPPGPRPPAAPRAGAPGRGAGVRRGDPAAGSETARCPARRRARRRLSWCLGPRRPQPRGTTCRRP